jgi:hypothetical protein
MRPNDGEMLTVDQQRFFVETRGGVYSPMAGAIFWLVLGVAVFYCRNGRGV